MLKELKRKDDEFYQTVFDLNMLNDTECKKKIDKFDKKLLRCLTKKYGDKEKRQSLEKEVSKKVSRLIKLIPQYKMCRNKEEQRLISKRKTMTSVEAIEEIRKQLPEIFLDILPDEDIKREIILSVREYFKKEDVAGHTPFDRLVKSAINEEVRKIVGEDIKKYQSRIKAQFEENIEEIIKNAGKDYEVDLCRR